MPPAPCASGGNPSPPLSGGVPATRQGNGNAPCGRSRREHHLTAVSPPSTRRHPLAFTFATGRPSARLEPKWLRMCVCVCVYVCRVLRAHQGPVSLGEAPLGEAKLAELEPLSPGSSCSLHLCHCLPAHWATRERPRAHLACTATPARIGLLSQGFDRALGAYVCHRPQRRHTKTSGRTAAQWLWWTLPTASKNGASPPACSSVSSALTPQQGHSRVSMSVSFRRKAGGSAPGPPGYLDHNEGERESSMRHPGGDAFVDEFPFAEAVHREFLGQRRRPPRHQFGHGPA